MKEFNVSAYPEKKNVDVTLESGSVELLNSKVETFQYQLKPGERAVIDKINWQITVNNVNISRFISWKHGTTRNSFWTMN